MGQTLKLLIIGNREGTNIGGCLERAAKDFGVETVVMESRRAMDAPRWLRRFNWHLRGHRPTWLNHFGDAVIEMARSLKPDLVLATGIAPVSGRVLTQLRADGMYACNYLTDDPWNPAHRAGWFLNALPRYSTILSPRRSVLPELRDFGCRRVEYLPFAYDPAIHFKEEALDSLAVPRADLLFIGGGDSERAPYLVALKESGIRLEIYGDYWGRYPTLAQSWHGYAGPETARLATGRARICLCLVRQANRDGHTMRSLEAAAMGGCLLVEHTAEHEELFGPEGEAVVYFKSIPEMVRKAAQLIGNDSKRCRLSRRVHEKVVKGKNTYRDRLEMIISAVVESRTNSPLWP